MTDGAASEATDTAAAERSSDRREGCVESGKGPPGSPGSVAPPTPASQGTNDAPLSYRFFTNYSATPLLRMASSRLLSRYRKEKKGLRHATRLHRLSGPVGPADRLFLRRQIEAGGAVRLRAVCRDLQGRRRGPDRGEGSVQVGKSQDNRNGRPASRRARRRRAALRGPGPLPPRRHHPLRAG